MYVPTLLCKDDSWVCLWDTWCMMLVGTPISSNEIEPARAIVLEGNISWCEIFQTVALCCHHSIEYKLHNLVAKIHHNSKLQSASICLGFIQEVILPLATGLLIPSTIFCFSEPLLCAYFYCALTNLCEGCPWILCCTPMWSDSRTTHLLVVGKCARRVDRSSCSALGWGWNGQLQAQWPGGGSSLAPGHLPLLRVFLQNNSGKREGPTQPLWWAGWMPCQKERGKTSRGHVITSGGGNAG